VADAGETFRTAPRSSMFRANMFSLECCGVLGLYGWLLLSPSILWPGHAAKDALRCQLLFALGVVYMLRLNLMARWLLPRELAMEELTVVIAWILCILLSYTAGALSKEGSISSGVVALSILLYCFGSWLNTWSELQRKWWKLKPENKGHCYTLGLFALSRNINYFGDVLLFLGWAVATGCWWNLWAPLVMAASFYFYHIPDKEAYLSQRYKAEWPEYSASTKAFVPYVC